jgi:hypothetical protein
LDADYRKIEVDQFVEELKHLTMDEKQILGQTLKKFPTLFGGGLGTHVGITPWSYVSRKVGDKICISR